MDLDFATISTIYCICAVVFGIWYSYHTFRGGANSPFSQQLRKVSAIYAAMPWVLYVSGTISVFLWSILWPYSLFTNLRALRRQAAVPIPFYFHPTLAKLRKAMNGQEEDYERILANFGLEVIVTALHAIDLPAAIAYGLRAIAQKAGIKVDDQQSPTPAGLQEPATTTYADVIKFAMTYTEIQALVMSHNRTKARRATELGEELLGRLDHIRNSGMCIGDLITFHVHGWGPQSLVTRFQQQYPAHLKLDFNTADHMSALLNGIRVIDPRNITRVKPKGADLSPEDHDELREEFLKKVEGKPIKSAETSTTSTEVSETSERGL